MSQSQIPQDMDPFEPFYLHSLVDQRVKFSVKNGSVFSGIFGGALFKNDNLISLVFKDVHLLGGNMLMSSEGVKKLLVRRKEFGQWIKEESSSWEGQPHDLQKQHRP